MTTRRTLTMTADPMHGWLSVAQTDLIHLGCVSEISSYSYMDWTRAYLEEDADAPVFLAAAKAAGWVITLKEKHTNESSWVRSKASYDPDVVTNPIRVGGRVRLLANDLIMDVISGNRLHFLIGTGDTVIHRLTKSNPYRYVTPL